MTLQFINVLYFSLLQSLVEKVVYRESDENPNCTVAVRSAFVDSQVFGLKRPIIAFGVKRYENNVQKTAMGFNHVLSRLYPKSTLR